MKEAKCVTNLYIKTGIWVSYYIITNVCSCSGVVVTQGCSAFPGIFVSMFFYALHLVVSSVYKLSLHTGESTTGVVTSESSASLLNCFLINAK